MKPSHNLRKEESWSKESTNYSSESRNTSEKLSSCRQKKRNTSKMNRSSPKFRKIIKQPSNAANKLRASLRSSKKKTTKSRS